MGSAPIKLLISYHSRRVPKRRGFNDFPTLPALHRGPGVKRILRVVLKIARVQGLGISEEADLAAIVQLRQRDIIQWSS